MRKFVFVVAIAMAMVGCMKDAGYVQHRAEEMREIRAIQGEALRLSEAGKHDQALAVFARAKQLDPDFSGIYATYARLHQAQGDYAAALANIDRAIDLFQTKRASEWDFIGEWSDEEQAQEGERLLTMYQGVRSQIIKAAGYSLQPPSSGRQ